MSKITTMSNHIFIPSSLSLSSSSLSSSSSSLSLSSSSSSSSSLSSFQREYSSNPHSPSHESKGTKFRYLIHGIPKNKKYTVEEAKGCHETQTFVAERTHTLSAMNLKHWLGYTPGHVGTIQTIMWLYLPWVVYSTTETRFPLEMWAQDKDIFIPFSLEKLRYFPHGNCQEQAAQIP